MNVRERERHTHKHTHTTAAELSAQPENINSDVQTRVCTNPLQNANTHRYKLTQVHTDTHTRVEDKILNEVVKIILTRKYKLTHNQKL